VTEVTDLSPEARAFADAWAATWGRQCTDALAADAADTGWPVTTVADVAALVSAGQRNESGVTESALIMCMMLEQHEQAGRSAANTLMDLGLTMHRHLPDWEDVRHWLALIVADPDEQAVQGVHGLLGSDEVDQWLAAVPGALMPWAWAAGLTIEEATDQYHAGGLTRAGLQTLLGMRGYRFSGVPFCD
jgi:hypothetical protein